MHVFSVVFAGLEETPIPTPTVDPDSVTPGPLGFLTIALVVIAVILLVLDMLRRVRRTRYREEVREMLDAEERAARGDEEAPSERGSAPADAEADPAADPDPRP